MWQRFLDRFVPVMDDAPSRLDRLDGVGRAPGASQTAPTVTSPDAASSRHVNAPHTG
jgi:hypothetical protein